MTDNPTSARGRSGPAGIDTAVPHSARIWNYWLGGKDWYAVDKRVGDAYAGLFPGIRDIARSSREFLARAVRYLAGEARIRQFLDVGTGLPTVENTHEVAQREAPDARIVYVDNDSLVLAHAKALLTSTPQGITDYVDADLRDPERIVRQAARTLDFTQPIALMLMGVLGHITSDDEAQSIVDRLVDALPPGSYLVQYDGTNTDETFAAAQRDYDNTGADPYRLRSPEQIARFFTGLDLLGPGVVPVPQWQPGPGPFETIRVDAYCGVARKPAPPIR